MWPIRGRIVVRFVVISCFVFLTEVSLAQRQSITAHHPQHYLSPSGRYDLHVVPTDLYAREAGRYRLTRDGVEIWSGNKSYTLFDAAVTDEGVVAGYAYTHGIQGFPTKGSVIQGGYGQFHVVILDVTGRERLNEETRREPSRFLHVDPDPFVNGIIVDRVHDRFILRLRDLDLNQGIEAWTVYRLSDGQKLRRFEPASHAVTVTERPWLVQAFALPDTPLILAYWFVADNRSKAELIRGARFTLIDPMQNAVWKLEWPHDYMGNGDIDEKNKLMWSITDSGAILGTHPEGRFELRCVAKNERIEYRAVPDKSAAGGWSVLELSHKLYVEAPASTSAVSIQEIPERPLKYLGTIQLSRQAASQPVVRNLKQFDFDDIGRVGFVRFESDSMFSFVLANVDGDVQKLLPLDTSINGKVQLNPQACWIEGNRWFIHAWMQSKGRHLAWWADTAAGTMQAIAKFDCPNIRAIATLGKGGFVVLSDQSELIAFDLSANRTWRTKQGDPQRSGLNCTESMTVTSRAHIAVLENVINLIEIFDTRGQFLRTIRLERAWSRKPSYPTEIVADREGGFIVNDFSGSPPLIWMKSDGSVIREIPKPRFPDGRAADLRNFRVSPDNRLWGCDGSAIMRLTNDGVVDAVLGAPPDAETLSEIAAVTIDRHDNIYIADRRTAAINVFARDGKLLRVCKPDTGDFSRTLSLAMIAVDRRGRVMLGGDIMEKGLVRFAPDGRRIGRMALSFDTLSETWYGHNATDCNWIVTYHNLLFVDTDGRVIKNIGNRPNGDWLDHPEGAAVAADGSIALLASSGLLFQDNPDKEIVTVNIYSPDAEPVRTIAMSSNTETHRIAYDGKRFVVGTDKELLMFDVEGKPILRFSPDKSLPAANRGDAESFSMPWWYFITHDGTELWLVDTKQRAIHRFAMPPA